MGRSWRPTPPSSAHSVRAVAERGRLGRAAGLERGPPALRTHSGDGTVHGNRFDFPPALPVSVRPFPYTPPEKKPGEGGPYGTPQQGRPPAGAARLMPFRRPSYLGTPTKSAARRKCTHYTFAWSALGGLPQKSVRHRCTGPRSLRWGENAGLSRHEAEDQHDDSQHTCATEHSLP